MPAIHPTISGTARRMIVLLLMMGLATTAFAEKAKYTLDNDPVRLGNKALKAGQLEEATLRYEEAVNNDYHLPDAFYGLAKVALRQGLLVEADTRYRQALAASGGRHAEAHAGLGLLLLREGRLEEAETEFDEALRIEEKLWSGHYGLARLAIEKGDLETAHQQLEFGRKVRGLDDGEDRYQFGMALYLLETGDEDGAQRAALRAQVLNSVHPDYAMLVARIYEDQGHDSLAISAFEQALATPGFVVTAPVLHELGRLYAQENRFNEASERYLQAVVADSTYSPAMRDLADLFYRAKRYDKAAGTYLRYVALNPADGQAQIQLSRCLVELGRYDEAASAAHFALQQNSEDQDTRFLFARAGIHARDESLKDEAATVMIALLDDPATDLAWPTKDLLDLAGWQSSRNDFDGAVGTLTRAAELAPDDAKIPFQLGLVELSAGRASVAVTHFRRATELDPDSAANYLNLGIAQYRAGMVKEAVPAFAAAVELRPDLSSARLLLAQALAATGSLPEAETEYRTVLSQEPGNAKALRGVGFCRIRAADYAAAADFYTRATETDPANADGWAGLGSARLGQGDLDAAEAAYVRARAIDPENIMLKTGTELLDQAKNAGKENQSR